MESIAAGDFPLNPDHGGAFDTGRTCFVMELVKGAPHRTGCGS